jgi:hypothetical protein
MRAVLIAGLALAAGVTLAGQSGPAKPPNTSIKAVVAAASKYVDEYARKLAIVVGDEVYIQEQFESSGLPPSRTRMIRGEIWVTFLPADRTWMAVHDVAEVDGEKVIDRLALRELLAKSATHSVLEQVADRNGRYNLGRRARNLNEPTLALLLLDKRVSSVEFKRELVEVVDGATLVTVSFVERDPSLVRNQNGRFITARGSMLIEAATGLVRQTVISFKEKPEFSELKTVFAYEPRLKMWLPSVFTELYESEPDGLKEIIKTRATYTNYRQFESFGRIRGGHE